MFVARRIEALGITKVVRELLSKTGMKAAEVKYGVNSRDASVQNWVSNPGQ